MVENIFCIGNGESRIGYDLDKLKPYARYMRNAMYRDYTPDVLCAVDMGIMHEIYNSVMHKTIVVFLEIGIDAW